MKNKKNLFWDEDLKDEALRTPNTSKLKVTELIEENKMKNLKKSTDEKKMFCFRLKYR